MTRTCLIVTNTSKEESLAMGDEVAAFLAERGVSADFCRFDGDGGTDIFAGHDLVVTLGGDGTVLYAARGCVSRGIPVFAVNLGQFGFIAGIQKDEWREQLGKFLDGGAHIDERSMLKMSVINGGGVPHCGVANGCGQCFDATSVCTHQPKGVALNDIVVSARSAARTVLLGIEYNYAPLCTYKADGIIVATATGSTAYSASAGGPIVDPALDAFVLTPINAFSLSSRPLVLPSNGEIGITVLKSRVKDVIITVDGQEPLPVTIGDRIKIRRMKQKVRLVGPTTDKFYHALRSKLGWQGGPQIV